MQNQFSDTEREKEVLLSRLHLACRELRDERERLRTGERDGGTLKVEQVHHKQQQASV